MNPEENAENVTAGPIKKRVRILDATYVEDRKGIFISGECDEGDFYHLIDRDSLGKFGNRDEEEIIEEMCKTSKLMVGKEIWLVFDPTAEERYQNGEDVSYKDLPETKVENTEKANPPADNADNADSADNADNADNADKD